MFTPDDLKAESRAREVTIPTVKTSGSPGFARHVPVSATLSPETEQIAGLIPDHNAPRSNSRGCAERGARLEFPEFLAVGQVQNVKTPVVRADINAPAGNSWR